MHRMPIIAAACVAVLSGEQLRASVAEAPLGPNAFASLGSISFPGTYYIDTGNGSSAPTITEISGGPPIVYTGVVSNGAAVFDFNSIDFPAGSTITTSGSLSLALLSGGSVSINADLNVDGVGQTAGSGGYNGGGPFASGTGPGAGIFKVYGSGGGGYGGQGGATSTAANVGGNTYGTPVDVFHGGSGGAGSPAGLGGGGGGAIEISALGDITIAGEGIQADGATANSEGGGGSGGGIFLATPGDVTLDAPVSANGGGGGEFAGDLSAGGGGGGGRILVESNLAIEYSTISVNGGTTQVGGDVGGDVGAAGTIAYSAYVSPSPEPTSLPLLGIAGLALLRRRPLRSH